MPDNLKDIVNAMLDRLKESLGISNDRDLAKRLGMTQQAFSGWRLRGYIDVLKLLDLDISLDYVILNKKNN